MTPSGSSSATCATTPTTPNAETREFPRRRRRPTVEPQGFTGRCTDTPVVLRRRGQPWVARAIAVASPAPLPARLAIRRPGLRATMAAIAASPKLRGELWSRRVMCRWLGGDFAPVGQWFAGNYAFSIAQELEHRGLLGDRVFWDTLVMDRPFREREIHMVEHIFISIGRVARHNLFRGSLHWRPL